MTIIKSTTTQESVLKVSKQGQPSEEDAANVQGSIEGQPDLPLQRTEENLNVGITRSVKSTQTFQEIPYQHLLDHDYGQIDFNDDNNRAPTHADSQRSERTLDLMHTSLENVLSGVSIENVGEIDIVSHVETVSTTAVRDIFSTFTFTKEWVVNFDEGIKMFKMNYETGGAIVSITISSTFDFSLRIMNQLLTEHPLLSDIPIKMLSQEDLRKFLEKLNSMHICSGTQEELYLEVFREKTVPNVTACWITNSIRHSSCCLLSKMKRCGNCVKMRSYFRNQICRRKKEKIKTAAFKSLNNSQLLFELKKSKSNEIKLKKKLRRREKKICKLIMANGEPASPKAESWLEDVLAKNVSGKTDDELCNADFPTLFLATQLKMHQLKSKKSRRWHPLVVHWCLFMYNQAPNLYKSLESSGILHLPSYRTLLRHTPDVGRKPNFQPGMFIQVAEDFKLNCLKEPQKYFSLLLDEMKVKEDLIYSKKTGDLVGYTKIKDPYDKIECINLELFDQKEKPIATHTLVFMIRGATTRLKAAIAHFPTNTITGDELHFLVWRAIALLELKGFKIISVIGDGASTNRKVFTKHQGSEFGCHKCVNVHASDEERFIYFVFDPPHLLKTVRNCLLNSRDGCKFRLMFKNGQDLVWNTIIDLFEMERGRPFRKAFKLSDDHVYPQAQQKMKVKLATQVISKTVANAIYEEFGDTKSETVLFLQMFNKWFDCMNAMNFQDGYHTRNPWVNPYKTLNDRRLKVTMNYIIQFVRHLNLLCYYSGSEMTSCNT